MKISELLHSYTETWKAHGADLKASYKVMYNHFIVLAVNENANAATGCSIDDSVRAMKSIQEHISTDLFSRLSITYKGDNGRVKICAKKEFRALLASEELNENTVVFNNMITSLGEFKDKWEVPVKESWHANVFLVQ